MNHIIRETASEMRAIARGALKDNWAVVIMTMGLFYVFTSVIPSVLSLVMPSAAYSVYNEVLHRTLSVSYVANLYTLILSGAFAVGLSSFLLAFFRRRETNPAHLFDGFEYFFKTFCLIVVEGVFIFLWSLLLFIPGIIAAFRYSQAEYILADDPSKGVLQCIRESKEIMAGNKGKLFYLYLSFIGWALLASLATAFMPSFSGVLGIILDFIYSIPYFAFLAYIKTAETAFYELATGHLAAKPEFREEEYHF